MKEVDNRISSLNNVYRYRDGVDKVFTRDIVWADVVREFYIDELRQKYGEEALERMYKRREIRREQLRKAEEERRRREEENERIRKEEEERQLKEEEERRKNSFWNKTLRGIKKFGETIMGPEEE
jgi:hypothetical protein